MKIQSVLFMSESNNHKSQSINNSKFVSLVQKPDSYTFTGAFKSFSHENSFEKPFDELLQIIINSNKYTKSEHFNDFLEVYNKKGLYGTLRTLWQATPIEKIAKTVSKHPQETLILAKTNNQSVLEIFNWGKHGFFNSIFETKSAPNDVRLLFSKNKTTLEFSLDKKGDLTVSRNVGDNFYTTTYYKETGTKKSETVQYGSFKPETTYYNKDGSKAFWKNFIYGGTPTEPIY